MFENPSAFQNFLTGTFEFDPNDWSRISDDGII